MGFKPHPDPARSVSQRRAPVGVAPLSEAKWAARCGRCAGKCVGKESMLSRQHVDDQETRRRSPQVRIDVDQTNQTRRISLGEQHRRHGQSATSRSPASCPHRHRRSDPPTQSAQRIPLPLRRHKRMLRMNRHAPTLKLKTPLSVTFLPLWRPNNGKNVSLSGELIRGVNAARTA